MFPNGAGESFALHRISLVFMVCLTGWGVHARVLTGASFTRAAAVYSRSVVCIREAVWVNQSDVTAERF